MKIAVLGKGPSLKYYSNLPKVNRYVIVNNFDQEVLQNDKIKEDLSKTPVTHVANRNTLSMQGMIDNDMYSQLRIDEHIQPYIDEMKCTHGGCYCGNFKDGYFEDGKGNKVPTRLLDSEHKDFMFKSGEQVGHPGNKYPYYYPSSGLAAIAYTVMKFVPEIIYLIGFDFHEGGYSVGDDVERNTAPDSEKLGQKYMLSKFINYYSSIEFFLHTKADFTYCNSNLILNKINGESKDE
tara:strand:- start:368 stop:1075 length:708 start_codon:yes stop_codon:yes gene_type:complete